MWAGVGGAGRPLLAHEARVIEHAARIRVFLPTSCPDAVTFTDIADALMPAGP